MTEKDSMPCVVAWANHAVHLGQMPNAVLVEIGEKFAIAGDRPKLITGIRDLMLNSTYPQLDSIFKVMGEIAAAHNCSECLRRT